VGKPVEISQFESFPEVVGQQSNCSAQSFLQKNVVAGFVRLIGKPECDVVDVFAVPLPLFKLQTVVSRYGKEPACKISTGKMFPFFVHGGRYRLEYVFGGL